jgi:hypothetical protein
LRIKFASCAFVNCDVKTTAQITEIDRKNKNITVSFADDNGEIHTAVIDCGIDISEIVSGQKNAEIKFNSQNPNEAFLYTDTIKNDEKYYPLIIIIILAVIIVYIYLFLL